MSYKPITDTVSIERLVGLAKDSEPDSALGIVWQHAYEMGFQNGRKEVLQDLRRKLEEKYREGEKEGTERGKEIYYKEGIAMGEYEEHRLWTTAGHSDRCFIATTILDDVGTQTDASDVTTTSIPTQTDLLITPTLTFVTTSTQTESPATNIDTMSPKPPVFDENTTKTQPATANGPSSSLTTQYDTKSTSSEPPFPLIHDPHHFPVAMSSLPAPADYISDAKICNTFEISTTDVALEPTTPVAVTYKANVVTDDVSTPGNATTTAEFHQIEQISENPPISAQITPFFVKNANDAPKTAISEPINWGDDAGTIPIIPTYPQHPPRDFSSLRSSFLKPFSSIQRRNKRFQVQTQRFSPFQHSVRYHVPPSRSSTTQFRVWPGQHRDRNYTPYFSSSATLNWEEDPRLFELSQALSALGWVRR